MAIVRKLLLVLALLVLLLLGAVFAVNNPEPIAVDVGFVRFDSVSMPVAFGVAFAAGWLFGVACAGFTLVRLSVERRRLRRRLESARAELDNAHGRSHDAG